MNTILRNLRKASVAKRLSVLLMLLGLAQQGYGQLLQWNTNGNLGTETFESSIYNNANIAGPANLTLGSGVSPTANGDRFGGNGWYSSGNSNPTTIADAISSNHYVQFTVTPNSGATFTPTSFVFSWERSSLGPASLSLRSSADNYAADLGSVSTTTTLASYTISISGLTNRSSSITFRLYGYGATPASSGPVGAGTGGFDQSSNAVNVQLNGTAVCGTPGTYFVTGGGTYCSGGAGVAVGLSSSEAGVSYQLKNGASNASSPVSGTGIGISFGAQTSTGTYTVVATRTLGGCTANMSGSATVAYNTSDINIQGFGNDITDGSTTTSAASLTNFNSVRVGSSTTRTFTIQNLGSTALSITGSSVSTAISSEFVVTASNTTLAPSTSTTFTVKFTPSTTGQRTAVIHILNGDCDEGDYDFVVEGTGRTSAALYVDASAAGSNDGSSWANAFTDFQGALSTASVGDTVFTAQGTYKPSIGLQPSPTGRTNTFTLANGAVYFGGFPAGGGSIASRDFSTYRTILSGDIGTPNVHTDNCFVVVNAAGLSASTVFNGFTVERARPDSVGYTMYSSGAVHLGTGGSMKLLNATVRNNNNAYACAGVYAVSPVNWIVTDCTFDNNTPTAGLYIGGYASGAVTNCIFSNNSGYNGGGVSMNTNTSAFSFTNCSFTGNHATQYAGAIAAAEGTNFTDCSFSNNTASEGGAIWSFYGVHTFTRCTFSQNTATGDAGVIRIPGFTGGADFNRCVFTNNSSTTGIGGAINISNRNSTITNCVFWKNTAPGYTAGAVYNNGGIMTVTNCSFNKNSCGSSVGGAFVNNSGSSAISNSIFWGNVAAGNDAIPASELYLYGPGNVIDNSIWQDNTSGGTIYNADPLFTNTTTGDLTLQDCSPAIDSGAANTLANDIIGNPRPVDVFPGGLSTDLGAYERQTAPLIPEINIHDGISAIAPHQIADGAASASTGNHTDFGSQTIGAIPASYTYTIQNTGTTALVITGSSIDNTTTGYGDFVISGLPASVGTGSTGTFTVTFTPSAVGARSAKIHIANNDCDENSYDFVVAGTGVCTTPTAFNITGGGAYCAGSTAPSIGVDNSETGMSYRLYRGTAPGGTAVGSAVSGSTGNAISFGSQATAGSYYVVATNPAGNCTTIMTGTTSVSINPLPTASIAINSPALSTICKGGSTTLTFTGTSGANVTYSDGSSTATITLTGGSASVSVSPLANTTYSLVSATSAAPASCTAALSGSVSVTVNAAPAFTTTTGNQTANASSSSCDAVVAYSTMPVITGTPAPTVTYAFTGATTASGSGTGSGATFNKGVTNVVITASNTCAPAATNSFTMTVSDVTPPTISCAGPVTINMTSGQCTGTTTLTAPAATDNCPSTLGNALDFDGTPSYATLPSGTYFNGDFTIEAWVYPRAFTNWSRIIDFGNGAGSNNVLLSYTFGTSGAPGFYIGGAQFAATSTLPLNQWSHVAATFSKPTSSSTTGTGTIYINGVAAGTATMPVPANVTRTLNYVGRSNWGTGDPDAKAIYDELRIWNVARTAGQLNAAMNTPLTGTEPGLQVYYNFNQGTACANNTSVPNINTLQNLGALGSSANATLQSIALTAGCTDNFTNSKTIPVSVTSNAPTTFPKGPTTVTWTATDASNNTATCTQTVTVVDNQKPVVTCPSDVSMNVVPNSCANSYAIVDPITDNCTGATWSASFSGNAAGNPTNVSGIADGTNSSTISFNKGITTVTLGGTDGTNAATACSFTVTVIDNVVPVITAPAAVSEVTSHDGTGNCTTTAALGAPIVSDNCGTVSYAAKVAGSTINTSSYAFAIGATTVTWVATDAAGNAASATQTVTISDDEVPTISAAGLAANAGGKTSDNGTGDCTTTVALGTPATSDNCAVASLAASVGGSAITPSSYLFPIGSTTVRWTVTDAANNSAFIDQTVTVIDDENPYITAPAAVAANADAGKCYATITSLGTPAASDNCSYTVTNDAPTNNQYPVGNTTVTWTVTDGANHSTTASQTITVSDNQAPGITAPANVTVAGYCQPVTAALGTPAVSDNCGVQSVVAMVGGAVINPATYLFPGGAGPITTTVNWKVTDIHGLTASATQNVTVNPATIAASAVAAPLYPMAGQKMATVFLNYPLSKQTDTMKVTAMGGTAPYSYSWTMSGCNTTTPGMPFSTGNTPYYIFNPSSLTGSGICAGPGADNIYTFNVKVTDNNGCTTSIAPKRLNVINPYVGDNVMVCHKVIVGRGYAYQPEFGLSGD